MEEEKEAGNDSQKRPKFKIKYRKRLDPVTRDDDDHQDQNIDHDQHLMKNKSADEQVQDHQENHQDLPFECPDCKKRFKSQLALGSHKKAHKRPTNNNNKRKGVCDDDSVCPFCEQRFRSMKLFCSHMKVHQDTEGSCESTNEETTSNFVDAEEASIAPMLVAHDKHWVLSAGTNGGKSGGGVHVCLDCMASFFSHQADEKAVKDDRDGDGGGRDDASFQNGGQHMCEDCEKRFPSYHALGGHRRHCRNKNIKR